MTSYQVIASSFRRFLPFQFRQLSTLANHMKIHTGEKPFSEKFQAISINSMLIKAFLSQNVMCVVENLGRAQLWRITLKFIRERNLTVSQWRLVQSASEASNRIFITDCTFCGKQFRQLSTLSNHVKIHTGECLETSGELSWRKWSWLKILSNWQWINA